MPETVWTMERVAVLRTRFADGASANTIARELDCGLSRNAVIGKLHRLGLRRAETRPTDAIRSARPRANYAGGQDYKTLHAIQRKAKEPLPADAPRDDAADLIRTEYSCDLMGLTERTCRWPCGSPGEPTFFFCGRPANYARGIVYCRIHTLRAAAQPLTITENDRARRHGWALKMMARAYGATLKRNEPVEI